jgi:hypothetical protein
VVVDDDPQRFEGVAHAGDPLVGPARRRCAQRAVELPHRSAHAGAPLAHFEEHDLVVARGLGLSHDDVETAEPGHSGPLRPAEGPPSSFG